MAEGLQKALAVVGIGFGALILIGLAANISEGKFDVLPDILLGSLFGVAPFVGGIYTFFSLAKKGKKQKILEQEKMIIRLAQKLGGRVSVLELTSKTKLSAEESKQALDEMYKKGLAELEITDSGAILYDFRGTGLTALEKNNAKPI